MHRISLLPTWDFCGIMLGFLKIESGSTVSNIGRHFCRCLFVYIIIVIMENKDEILSALEGMYFEY